MDPDYERKRRPTPSRAPARSPRARASASAGRAEQLRALQQRAARRARRATRVEHSPFYRERLGRAARSSSPRCRRSTRRR